MVSGRFVGKYTVDQVGILGTKERKPTLSGGEESTLSCGQRLNCAAARAAKQSEEVYYMKHHATANDYFNFTATGQQDQPQPNTRNN